MSIKIGIGMYLCTLGMTIARFGLDLTGVTEEATEDEDGPISVYCILDGPFTQSDVGEYGWGGPEDYEAYLLVKVEHMGVVSDVEWYFETVEEAFVWVRHFKTSIDPIVIESGDTNV